MGLKLPDKNWWETDTYDRDVVIPHELTALAGPNDLGLVRLYSNGTTQEGWGLNPPKHSNEGFMSRYNNGEFLPRRTLYGYEKGDHAAALITRTIRGFAVDIDGKNGGLEGVNQLGPLPFTLAEISKSGNGYHLIYETDEEWSLTEGFGLIPDQIGIVPGVDIRGGGCVYHHHAQRWNNRPIAKAPEWLITKLLEKKLQRTQATNHIKSVLNTFDSEEILMMQSDLKDQLAKPIPAGKRNNTLFAIGSQMKEAEIDNWPKLIEERGQQLKLDQPEIDRIIENIGKYNN